jgi:Coenzyme PQQ synthesis protein D (PqqD)
MLACRGRRAAGRLSEAPASSTTEPSRHATDTRPGDWTSAHACVSWEGLGSGGSYERGHDLEAGRDEGELRLFRPSGRIIHEMIEGEVIIVHLDTGSYYSLRESGAIAWESLARGSDVETVVEALGAHYDSSPGQMRPAIQRLTEELASEGLIEASNETDGAAPVARSRAQVGNGIRPAFAPPVLEKHTDMQDLILLDPVHEVDARGWPHAADAESGGA